MKNKILLLILLYYFSTTIFSQSKQQFAKIGNLTLESGDTLFNCEIGYQTFGKINADSSNVIIYPTWFAGTSSQISRLVQKSKFIDDSKYFVIAIDALANGVSTSPSNSKLQKGKAFPIISIIDMVNSQYKLLTKTLGFKHIYAIVGGSMGSMQALQWIVTYPDFIDKAVPYVATPRRSSYDDLLMRFRKRMIHSYQELGASDSLINIMLNYSTQLFARSPAYIVENISHEKFENYISEKIENRKPIKTFPVENHLAQLNAMESYNIYKHHNNSVSETAKHIKAEVFFILNKTDHMVNPAPALKLAKELNSNVLLLDNNCGHLGIGCELRRCADSISVFLDSKLK